MNYSLYRFARCSCSAFICRGPTQVDTGQVGNLYHLDGIILMWNLAEFVYSITLQKCQHIMPLVIISAQVQRWVLSSNKITKFSFWDIPPIRRTFHVSITLACSIPFKRDCSIICGSSTTFSIKSSLIVSDSKSYIINVYNKWYNKRFFSY